jgi:omega-6 fatty acid desaturase (delta-12 desaturase)
MADGSYIQVDSPIEGDGLSSRQERERLVAGLDKIRPSTTRSLLQFGVTLSAYLATMATMYVAFHFSVWLSMVFVLPAAGLVVRLFVFQHDCGHGAYFRSQRGNEIAGRICSLITFTPYAHWRRNHAKHHAAWNNLDRRDDGVDIYVSCLTLNEYQAKSRLGRWLYRLSRHPIVTQLLVPPFVFLVLFRTPFETPKAWRRERLSVLFTNISLVAIVAALIACLGWQAVLAVHLSVMVTASIIGIWMFAVQHRFEDTAWMSNDEWNLARAALKGTSYFKLPPVLQWFTGNIGFHHVHHLLPRVPNYDLQACHDVLATRSDQIRTLTLKDAWRAPRFALWNEAESRMVPFPSAVRSQ